MIGGRELADRFSVAETTSGTPMNVMERVRSNPAFGAGIAGALVVIAAIVAFSSTRNSAGGSSRAFFTTDDGATWFADSESKIPPFDHGGKEAVRAFVFEAGGKTFVNHLERATLEGKKFLQSVSTPGPRTPLAPGASLKEVKRPGGQWVASSDLAKAGPIMAIKLPPGSTGEAIAVEP